MKRYLFVVLSATALLMNANSFASANRPPNIYVFEFSNHKHMITDTMSMVLTRDFDATPEQVWKAWTSEELVKQCVIFYACMHYSSFTLVAKIVHGIFFRQGIIADYFCGINLVIPHKDINIMDHKITAGQPFIFVMSFYWYCRACFGRINFASRFCPG